MTHTRNNNVIKYTIISGSLLSPNALVDDLPYMDSPSEQYIHVHRLDYYPRYQLSFVLRVEQINHVPKKFWIYDFELCAHMVQLCRT
jgi:hypothetical protein